VSVVVFIGEMQRQWAGTVVSFYLPLLFKKQRGVEKI